MGREGPDITDIEQTVSQYEFCNDPLEPSKVVTQGRRVKRGILGILGRLRRREKQGKNRISLW